MSQPPLPRDILDRVDRVWEFHQSTRLTDGASVPPLDDLHRTSPYRTFETLPKVALPTTLLGASAATLSLLNLGLDALPESQLRPPQDLKTLATWLYLANGRTEKREENGHPYFLRTCPSERHLFPHEIYVAAFAIEGLEPGLYHYTPREFALRKLRDGTRTLAQIRRGRPDLAFLKDLPGVMLVSSVFCRATSVFGKRGYRAATVEAGRVVQNLITSATALGIQTLTRLQMNDYSMRELIGVPAQAEFGDAEAVQAMVAWADQAQRPIGAASPTSAPLDPVERHPLAREVVAYGSVVATHEDCVAPGVGVREVRPPTTDLSPLPPQLEPMNIMLADDPWGGAGLMQTVLQSAPAESFGRKAVARHEFLSVNRVAFRGGSYFPVLPDGPHVGLVRPFWIVSDVTGLDEGVWYYHPLNDRVYLLNAGTYRFESKYLAFDHSAAADASAICVLVAHLPLLMSQAGPDLYRLAHLEAGIVAQRMHLAATSMGLGSCSTGLFYDEEIRKFLGLGQTGWHPLLITMIGRAEDAAPAEELEEVEEEDFWKD